MLHTHDIHSIVGQTVVSIDTCDDAVYTE